MDIWVHDTGTKSMAESSYGLHGVGFYRDAHAFLEKVWFIYLLIYFDLYWITDFYFCKKEILPYFTN